MPLHGKYAADSAMPPQNGYSALLNVDTPSSDGGRKPPPPPRGLPPPSPPPPPTSDPGATISRDVHIGSSFDLPIVQFGSSVFYCEEDEGVVKLSLMRLATNAHGPCEVNWETKDASGVAGRRYERGSGVVRFGKRDLSAEIKVNILDTETFDPTLEFHVNLFNAKNCYLGLYLNTCRVKVIDNDLFPSSKYKAELEQPGGAHRISEYGLMLEYLMLAYQQTGIRWRTMVHFLMDQLGTAHLWLTIRLQIYLVNVVLNVSDEQTEDMLWIAGNRPLTASAVGMLWCAPMIFIIFAENLQVKLDLIGLLVIWIRRSLFRRYLNYSDEALLSISEARVHTMIMHKAETVASSYLAALGFVTTALRVLMLMTIVSAKHPRALFVMCPMVMAFGLWGYFRLPKLLKENRVLGRANNALSMFTVDTSRFYSVIKDYSQRPMMNDQFGEKAIDSATAALVPNRIRLNNALFGSCLGPICIGVYITIFSEFVFAATLSLGSFLAMIGVIKTISDNMNKLFESGMHVLGSAGPLRSLTTMMNQATDCEMLMAIDKWRQEETQERWKNSVSDEHFADEAPVFDLLPIQLKNVGFLYSPVRLHSMWLFKEIGSDIPQGSVVGVVGTNKGPMMHLLGGRKVPHRGYIFLPTHLRVLHVPPEPIVLNMSCWKNLTFGMPGRCDKENEVTEVKEKSVFGVLDQLGLQMLKDFITRPEDRMNDKEIDWIKYTETMSWKELMKMDLARALLCNTEVLVVQRPLDHFREKEEHTKMVAILKDHCIGRGLGLSLETATTRRPRTVFLTMEDETLQHHLDIVLNVDMTAAQLVSNDFASPRDQDGQCASRFSQMRENTVSQALAAAKSQDDGDDE